MDKIRVVLVEDDELTRLGLKTELQQHPDIEWLGEAMNGNEGLRLIRQTQPDICIVDIGLPGIDGIELTRRFKSKLSEARNPQSKVLILTLQDDQDAVLAAFAAGADSYCMKDITIERLVEALSVTQEGNAWIDPAIARLVLAQINSAPSATSPAINPLANGETYQQLLKTHPLTERELQVLQLIVDGCSNAEIAQRLYITIGTVKTHVRNILNKLCADDRTQAAVRALRSGLVG